MSALLQRLLLYGIASGIVVGTGNAFWFFTQPPSSAAVIVAQTDPARPGQTAQLPQKDLQKQFVPPGQEPPQDGEPRRFFGKPGRGFKGGGFFKKERASLSDRLGARFEKPSDETIVKLGLAESDGLVATEVRDGSSADKAGFKVGDILVRLDGRDVPSDVDQFHYQLENIKTGEAIDAVVIRDGNMITLQGVILAEPAARPFPFPRRPFDPPG
jgi:membrane-associated protease RseP (regulator of RpoE activity)